MKLRRCPSSRKKFVKGVHPWSPGLEYHKIQALRYKDVYFEWVKNIIHPPVKEIMDTIGESKEDIC